MLMGMLTSGSSGGFVPSSAESAAFLARTSGLSNTLKGYYDTMITGMVTDGTWSLLDALYIFATDTTTNANLNLIQTSYPITGSTTFTANFGYTGTGGSISTGFTPSTASSPKFALNSATFGVYIQSLVSGASANIPIFTQNVAATSYTFLRPNNGSNQMDYCISDITFTTSSPSPSDIKGLWQANRNGAVSSNLYKNTTSLFGSGSAPTVSLSDTPILLCLGVTPLSAAFFGQQMTGTQITNTSNRINAFMTSQGVNVY